MKTPAQMSNKILHVDGDNFFVACEIARFPHLKGKPVIVGEERGIASAMSYEAKNIGVTRGMPVFEIRKRFPEVTILPSHFELYEQYAEKLWRVLCKYSDNVERYSIDECFAEISEKDLQKSYSHANSSTNSTNELLKKIKQDAEECLGITLSFGLADTKTLAKIGSKHDKPSGCVTIDENNRISFLQKTDIGKVWGIGRAISASLTSFNVKTAEDFIKLDSSFVKKNFGEGTLSTWHELRGERRLEITTESKIPKSLQSTRSFGKSIVPGVKERAFFLSELSTHTELICMRLRAQKLKTNRISFFIKKNTLIDKYISREIQLGFYTNNPADLYKVIEKSCTSIFNEFDYLQQELQQGPRQENTQNFGFKCKATGISVYQVKPLETVQDDLFATQSTNDTKTQYNEAVDSLRRRFGNEVIGLCSSLESKNHRLNIFNQRNSKNKFMYGLPLPYMGEVN